LSGVNTLAGASEKTAGVVVVAIVSYGRPGDVVGCLTALTRSRLTGFEVVVIENAGAAAFDGLNAALKAAWPVADPAAAGTITSVGAARAEEAFVRARRFRLPGGQPVLVVEACDNLGYGGGVNVAIRCLGEGSGWRGLWVLNPDTEPEPTALLTVVEYAESGGYGLVGCCLAFAGQDRIQMRGGGSWQPLIGRAVSLGYGEPVTSPVDVAAVEQQLRWISGAALYATREFVETVGPMSEKYFLYCEDVEWSLRRGRFRLGYAHAAIVRHEHGTTIGSAARIGSRSNLSVYLSQRNTLLLTRECFPVLYPVVVMAGLALTLDYLARGGRRVFAAACRGWWAGVRGEIGRPRGSV
jgi:N-acetylglucosaminyl-diphospho-decaprenol L-rhamnosyltransferase